MTTQKILIAKNLRRLHNAQKSNCSRWLQNILIQKKDTLKMTIKGNKRKNKQIKQKTFMHQRKHSIE